MRNFLIFWATFNPMIFLILNESAVIPARLIGEKETGGKVEVMLERFLSSSQTLVQIRSSRSPKENSIINFVLPNNRISAKVLGRQDNFFILEWRGKAEEIFQQNAAIPLPPYIDRDTDDSDKNRYQTVYANMDKQFSVAAPTAGLHFDNLLLTRAKKCRYQNRNPKFTRWLRHIYASQRGEY